MFQSPTTPTRTPLVPILQDRVQDRPLGRAFPGLACRIPSTPASGPPPTWSWGLLRTEPSTCLAQRPCPCSSPRPGPGFRTLKYRSSLPSSWGLAPHPGPHLLADEAEAPVRPLTFIGLAQNRVEGLAARPVVRGRVGRDSEGRDVHLRESRASVTMVGDSEEGSGKGHPTASKVWGLDVEL